MESPLHCEMDSILALIQKVLFYFIFPALLNCFSSTRSFPCRFVVLCVATNCSLSLSKYICSVLGVPQKSLPMDIHLMRHGMGILITMTEYFWRYEEFKLILTIFVCLDFFLCVFVDMIEVHDQFARQTNSTPRACNYWWRVTRPLDD